MKQKSITIGSRWKSMQYAANGIWIFLQQEMNARIHFIATILVSVGIILCPLKSWEVVALIVVTGCVWVAEMINTVIERIMDHLSPGHHVEVGRIKDMAAGAVLVAAIMAAITAVIIFLPKLF